MGYNSEPGQLYPPLPGQDEWPDQNAHEVGTPTAEPGRDQPDDGRCGEGGNAHGAPEEKREEDEQAQRGETEPRVVHPPDRGQVPVAEDEDEHESRGGGDGDARQQQWQVQWRVRRLERDQHARPGGAQGEEGEQREDRVRIDVNTAKTVSL